MPDDHDDDLSDSEEEEDWGGVWDDRCREICHDMRLNKSNGDHFASERVQELLKKNSKYLSATAPSGKLLLHWAAYAGCQVTVQLLLSRGARKDLKDCWQKLPYDYAIQTGQNDIMLKALRVNG